MNKKIYIPLSLREKVVYIVGMDTYLGVHFAKHWLAHGYQVYGCGREEHINLSGIAEYFQTDYTDWHIPRMQYSWLMFCCDAHDGFDSHIGALRSMIGFLNRNNSSVRIVYPSSVTIADASSSRIKEETRIYPHNEYETTIATAENWLHAIGCETDSRLLSYIVRFGEIYGTEISMPSMPGLINLYVHKAKNKEHIGIPGLGNNKRSLCFIGDACEAVLHILQDDFPPLCFNIPGEKYTIIDAACAITKRFGTDAVLVDGKTIEPDYSPYSGDKVLSESFFNSLTDFRPTIKFSQWLSTI